MGDFPGGPVVRTLRFHCKGHSQGIKIPVGDETGFISYGKDFEFYSKRDDKSL